ncbi:MAG: hypothetical protein ACOY30_10380 [Bacillota bacterium]
MQGELKERPTFDIFKAYLRKAVREIMGVNIDDRHRWLDIGDEGQREEILNTLKRFLEAEYGVELVIPENLKGQDIAFETVAIQLHHVYSTVYLMARINRKIFARRQNSY